MRDDGRDGLLARVVAASAVAPAAPTLQGTESLAAGGDAQRSTEAFAEEARTLREILEEPRQPPQPLIEGLLAYGITVIGADSFAGKSTLAYELAVALTSGTPALETFGVASPKRVLYVAGEQGPERHEYGLAFAAATRSAGGWHDRLVFRYLHAFDLSKPEHLKWMLGEIRRMNADVVILDSKTSLFGGVDENDALDSRRTVREPLQRLVREGVDVVLLHHAPKTLRDYVPTHANELLRGSGDLAAMASQVLGLWRHRSGRTKLLRANRFGEDAPLMLVPRYSGEGKQRVMSFQHGGPWAEGGSATRDVGTPAAHRAIADQRAVVEIIERRGALPRSEIERLLGWKRDRAHRALKAAGCTRRGNGPAVRWSLPGE